MAGRTEDPAHTSALALGANLVGYFDSHFGLGEAVRNVEEALDAAGVSVARLGLGPGAAAADAPHPVTIVCANPDGMAGARAEQPAAFARTACDRPVVVGGHGLPEPLAARVRRRRRAMGGLALRGRRAGRRLAGPGRGHANAGPSAAAGAGRPRRAGPARRLPVRVRLRLRKRGRAQEPTRCHQGVRARLPGPAATAPRRSCSRRWAGSAMHASTARSWRRRPRTRGSTSSTAACRAPSATP